MTDQVEAVSAQREQQAAALNTAAALVYRRIQDIHSGSRGTQQQKLGCGLDSRTSDKQAGSCMPYGHRA